MKIKRLAEAVVMLAAWFALMGTACADEVNTRDWEIPFIGTLQVPARMEIIEIRDVLAEAIKFDQQQAAKKAKILPLPPKDKAAANKQLTIEDVDKLFKTYNFGVYEFAVKTDGTYSTALAFAVKLPGKMTPGMQAFFNKMRDTTTQQEEEIRSAALRGLELVYAQQPDLRDFFELEILEFAPFDRITGGDAETIGAGCSVAFRVFKLIYPAAGKVFFTRKDNELYIFGIVSAGLDRKMWAETGVDMVNSIRWNAPAK